MMGSKQPLEPGTHILAARIHSMYTPPCAPVGRCSSVPAASTDQDAAPALRALQIEQAPRPPAASPGRAQAPSASQPGPSHAAGGSGRDAGAEEPASPSAGRAGGKAAAAEGGGGAQKPVSACSQPTPQWPAGPSTTPWRSMRNSLADSSHKRPLACQACALRGKFHRLCLNCLHLAEAQLSRPFLHHCVERLRAWSI